MKKKWHTERKWEVSRPEIRFEELLKENGFNVIGIKEFVSKTDYLIEKDGIEVVYVIHHVDNKSSRGNLCFNIFVDHYNLKAKYEKLKSQLEQLD